MTGGRARSGLTVAGVLLAAGGALLLLLGTTASAAPPAPAQVAVAALPGSDLAGLGARVPSAVPQALPRSVPVQLATPRIGVRTPLMALALNRDGTVEVPPLETRAPAGWYRYLASPGEPGPAVILGHVDTYRGPAVFYRLGLVQPGDSLAVLRADGSTVSFRVSSVRECSKAAFPTAAGYGPSPVPVLRLVTRGGAYDPVHRSYRDVVAVEADMVRRP